MTRRHSRKTRVLGVHAVLRDLELAVAATVALVPLELAVVACEQRGLVIGSPDGTTKTGRSDFGTSELENNSALNCSLVVFVLVKPDQVTDLVCVGVAGKHDVIVQTVLVHSVESAVAVRLEAIPLILIVGILKYAKLGADVNPREGNLVSNDTPSSATISGVNQLSVQPVLFLGAYEGAASIVADVIEVFSVPVCPQSEVVDHGLVRNTYQDR